MKSALSLVVFLALAGCATQQQRTCPAPQTAKGSALALEGYALAGRVNSLLVENKLSAIKAVELNRMLQTAESDLRSGKKTAAKQLIDSVKGALP